MKDFLGYNFQLIKGNKWDSRLLIVKGNKMYIIDTYFSVTEVDEMTSLGYDNCMLGALEDTKDENVEDSILSSVRNLNRLKSRCLFPLMIFDSKTKKRKFYTK